METLRGLGRAARDAAYLVEVDAAPRLRAAMLLPDPCRPFDFLAAFPAGDLFAAPFAADLRAGTFAADFRTEPFAADFFVAAFVPVLVVEPVLLPLACFRAACLAAGRFAAAPFFAAGEPARFVPAFFAPAVAAFFADFCCASKRDRMSPRSSAFSPDRAFALPVRPPLLPVLARKASFCRCSRSRARSRDLRARVTSCASLAGVWPRTAFARLASYKPISVELSSALAWLRVKGIGYFLLL